MPRVSVPEDYEGRGTITVAGTADSSRSYADVTVDTARHARDLTIREDDEGRYVGPPVQHAAEVAEHLGVEYEPPTDGDVDGDGADATEDTSEESVDDSGASDADSVEPGDTICGCGPEEACDTCGGKCPTVKSDGEVCGRDRPCSYHDK